MAMTIVPRAFPPLLQMTRSKTRLAAEPEPERSSDLASASEDDDRVRSVQEVADSRERAAVCEGDGLPPCCVVGPEIERLSGGAAQETGSAEADFVVQGMADRLGIQAPGPWSGGYVFPEDKLSMADADAPHLGPRTRKCRCATE